MTTKQVVKASKISNINISDITISTKKVHKKVSITLNHKPIVCQTPFLEARGELKKTPFPNIYQINTLFKGESKKKVQQWYQFIENLESHISDQVIRNGAKWFTQNNITIKSLTRNTDSQDEYFMKWPLDLHTNIFSDQQKNLFDPHSLREKDLIKLIIEIPSLWVDGNQFGLAVIVQKVMVKSYAEKIQNEYIFDETESDPDLDDKENDLISLLATEQKKKTTVL